MEHLSEGVVPYFSHHNGKLCRAVCDGPAFLVLKFGLFIMEPQVFVFNDPHQLLGSKCFSC